MTQAHHLSKLRRIGGYTLDQMILIVAIIAILVTIVILSIGWSIISRSSGTKLASQFKQVEDANGQFYAHHHVWPHQAFASAANATAVNNARMLVGLPVASFVAYANSIDTNDLRNFITGFRDNGTNVTHNFATTGNTITQLPLTWSGMTGQYLVVQFANVPFSEVIEAELAVDGGSRSALANTDFSAGRIRATTAASCLIATPASPPNPTAGATQTSMGTPVQVCYASNLIQ